MCTFVHIRLICTFVHIKVVGIPMITSTDYPTKVNQQIFLKIRNALFLSFLIIGFVMASWIVRTPSIRDILHASTMEMGFVLFGFSLGSMSGIILARKLIIKIGVDYSISLGLILALLGLITLAAGALIISIWLIGFGLCFIGFGVAISEVSVNYLGSYIEQILKRPVLTLIHGCFSLGTVLGGVWGVILLKFDLDLVKHMLSTFLLVLPICLFIMVQINHAPGSKFSNESKPITFKETIHNDPKLIIIGLIVLSVALAEGAANDWLPLLIVDSFHVPEQYGSLIFIVFAMTMTIGRFLGNALLYKFNNVIVLRMSCIIGALGVLILVLSTNIYIASFAVILWGIGASLGFPITMSAGAGTGKDAASRISILAIIGYTAYLVGPPLLGFIGEHIGLRFTMLIIFVLLFIPILFTKVLLPKNFS